MIELIWIVLGLVPYRIEKKYLPDGSWVFAIKLVQTQRQIKGD